MCLGEVIHATQSINVCPHVQGLQNALAMCPTKWPQYFRTTPVYLVMYEQNHIYIY